MSGVGVGVGGVFPKEAENENLLSYLSVVGEHPRCWVAEYAFFSPLTPADGTATHVQLICFIEKAKAFRAGTFGGTVHPPHRHLLREARGESDFSLTFRKSNPGQHRDIHGLLP